MKSKSSEVQSLELVADTPFEKLMARINAHKEKIAAEARECETKRNLILTTASVYCFLRDFLGMPDGNLSLKEFEGAEEALRKFAETEARKIRLGNLFQTSHWHFFLKNGFFAPGFSFKAAGKRAYCEKLTPRYRKAKFYNFNPKDILNEHRPENRMGCDVFPVNIFDLCREILAKRHPQYAKPD